MRNENAALASLILALAGCGHGHSEARNASAQQPTSGSDRVTIMEYEDYQPPAVGETAQRLGDQTQRAVAEGEIPTEQWRPPSTTVPQDLGAIDRAAAELDTPPGPTITEPELVPNTVNPGVVAEVPAPSIANETLEATASVASSPGLDGEICPAGLTGLQARMRNVSHGGAITFSTDAAQQAELRARLRRFALLHDEEAQEQGDSRVFADDGAMIHQAHLRVVETADGARLEFRFDQADARVRELRAELREQVEAIHDGRCPLALQRAT